MEGYPVDIKIQVVFTVKLSVMCKIYRFIEGYLMFQPWLPSSTERDYLSRLDGFKANWRGELNPMSIVNHQKYQFGGGVDVTEKKLILVNFFQGLFGPAFIISIKLER